jgi:hypothetical protein
MVVLVRCCDDSCSLALKSRLDKLINAGLISAVLRDGEWVKTGLPALKQNPVPRRPKNRMTTLVSSI